MTQDVDIGELSWSIITGSYYGNLVARSDGIDELPWLSTTNPSWDEECPNFEKPMSPSYKRLIRKDMFL